MFLTLQSGSVRSSCQWTEADWKLLTASWQESCRAWASPTWTGVLGCLSGPTSGRWEAVHSSLLRTSVKLNPLELNGLMIFVSLCWQYLRESSFEEELYMWRSFLRHKLVLSCGQAFSCSTPGWFRIVFADQHNHLQLGQFPVYIQPSYAQSFSVSKLGLVVLEQWATSSYIPPPPISPLL